jgi:hypothetical protein
LSVFMPASFFVSALRMARVFFTRRSSGTRSLSCDSRGEACDHISTRMHWLLLFATATASQKPPATDAARKGAVPARSHARRAIAAPVFDRARTL